MSHLELRNDLLSPKDLHVKYLCNGAVLLKRTVRTPIETHVFVCVCTTKWTLEVLNRETEWESCVPVCQRCCEIKNSPPPGGKAKLSGVRGHRHRSGHTRVRALFTTGEAHLRPPTSALPQYCTSAGGALHQDPPGGSKALYTAFQENHTGERGQHIFCCLNEPI